MSKVKTGDTIIVTHGSNAADDRYMKDKLIGHEFTVVHVDAQGDPWFATDITWLGKCHNAFACVDQREGMTFEVVSSL